MTSVGRCDLQQLEGSCTIKKITNDNVTRTPKYVTLSMNSFDFWTPPPLNESLILVLQNIVYYLKLNKE